MASLLNGLSAAGGGLAGFAAATGLESQKNDAALVLQSNQQQFQAGQQTSAQTFQTGLMGQKAELDRQAAVLADQLATKREASHLTLAGSIAEGAQGRQQAFQSTEAERARQAALDAPTPEMKSALQYAKASPEVKRAFREEAMTKAGLPPWMIGDDQAGGPAPASTAPTGAPSDATGAPVTGDTAAAPSRPGLNEDALKKLPAPAVSLVKGMVDGRISPPSSFAASKPYWQNLIQMATTYDPTFDETTWAGRVATRKDFASGKSAVAVTALNTALSHAGTLVEDFDKLNNGSIPFINKLYNEGSQALGGSALTKASETRDALASEARKVFAASGGGNLTELQEWQKNFPLNGSPGQQKAALVGFVDLLDGRLQGLADQYNRGMGKTDDPLNLLSPKAKAAYEKLAGREPPTESTGYQTGKPPGGSTSPATPSSAPPASIPSWVKPGDQYSPSRGQARGADGTVYGPP